MLNYTKASWWPQSNSRIWLLGFFVWRILYRISWNIYRKYIISTWTKGKEKGTWTELMRPSWMSCVPSKPHLIGWEEHSRKVGYYSQSWPVQQDEQVSLSAVIAFHSSVSPLIIPLKHKQNIGHLFLSSQSGKRHIVKLYDNIIWYLGVAAYPFPHSVNSVSLLENTKKLKNWILGDDMAVAMYGRIGKYCIFLILNRHNLKFYLTIGRSHQINKHQRW